MMFRVLGFRVLGCGDTWWGHVEVDGPYWRTTCKAVETLLMGTECASCCQVTSSII